jgi:hypothetical protein
MSADLFDATEWRLPPAIGMTVKLDRDVDRQHPCHDNLAVLHPGKAGHAAELRCATCGHHRGWASKAMIEFITETARRFGAPSEPLIWRQEEADMAKEYDNTNRGALFRNDDKDGENDRDYSGTLNVDGREFWLSGWIKTSKKSGAKFLSLSVKAKDGADKAKPKASRAQEMDDAIPF